MYVTVTCERFCSRVVGQNLAGQERDFFATLLLLFEDPSAFQLASGPLTLCSSIVRWRESFSHVDPSIRWITRHFYIIITIGLTNTAANYHWYSRDHGDCHYHHGGLPSQHSGKRMVTRMIRTLPFRFMSTRWSRSVRYRKRTPLWFMAVRTMIRKPEIHRWRINYTVWALELVSFAPTHHRYDYWYHHTDISKIAGGRWWDAHNAAKVDLGLYIYIAIHQ